MGRARPGRAPARSGWIQATGARAGGLRVAHLGRELLGVHARGLGDRPRRARGVGADLVGHLGRVDDDQPRVAPVDDLAERLEVVAVHGAVRVAGHRAEGRPGAAAHGKRADDADGREQRDHGARGEPPRQAHGGAVLRRLVVPAHDLHLARRVLRDHGGVEVVRRRHVAIRDLDRLIVRERVLDVVVGRGQHVQRLAHASPSSMAALRRASPRRGRRRNGAGRRRGRAARTSRPSEVAIRRAAAARPRSARG